MKKLVTAILCLIMCLTAVCGFAAEAANGFEMSAEYMMEWHDYFLENAYGDNWCYPIIRLSDNEYPGCVAFSTDSRLVDIVCDTGDTDDLQLINIIIFRSDLENDPDAFAELIAHFVGTMYLYLPDMVAVGDSDAFIDDLVAQMLLAYEQPSGTVWYADPVDFGGVAEVVAYVENSDTFGIYIWFYEPVTYNFLVDRAEMMKE